MAIFFALIGGIQCVVALVRANLFTCLSHGQSDLRIRLQSLLRAAFLIRVYLALLMDLRLQGKIMIEQVTFFTFGIQTQFIKTYPSVVFTIFPESR